MSEQERNGGRADDRLSQPEEGATGAAGAMAAVEGPGEGTWFQPVGAGREARLAISNSTGAIRVRGDEASAGIALRAVKPSGETVPLELVADLDYRPGGEVVVKARPFGEVQRQVRRFTKSLDFGRADFLDNLGEMIDTLAQMKTVGRNLGQVAIEATVPARCDLQLQTASAPIAVEGVAGEIELKSASGALSGRRLGGKVAARTASGDVRVDGVEGTAYLQSVSGEVDARGVTGDVVIHTTSGDVRAREIAGQLGFKSLSGELGVERSRLSGFYINTTSGECAIDAHLEPGSYEVRTVSGEVALRAQPDLAAVLTGRTVSGEFRCALPYRYAGDDWRPRDEDDDEREADGGDEGGDEAEIALPGIRIGKGRVELPGIKIDDRGVGILGMRIDDEGIDMPGLGVHIGKEGRDRWEQRWDKERERDLRRERRRSRNRWEFLIGDPATAAGGQTRIRIRTVSGAVTIREGRGGAAGFDSATSARTAADAARGAAERATANAARPAPGDRRGWPDSELWPSRPEAETGGGESPRASAEVAMPTPPEPPIPPVAPTVPDAPPTPPTPPTPPAPPAPPEVAQPEGSVAAADAGDTGDAPSGEPVADAPPAASVAPVADRERTRLDILEALERGEINADEALRLLRRLEL